MKAFLSVALLLAWFVTFEFPEPDLKGVTVKMVVGPFEKRGTCENYREFLKWLSTENPQAKLGECTSQL